jgi:glycosyltransferase involved in cell wall biosynthesis
MAKEIRFYVQRYRPSFEAISKEVAILNESFLHTQIHDLHLDGIFNIKWNKKIKSYHFGLYPILALFIKLQSIRQGINHIYTSLGDLPYLHVLNLNRTILTAAASCKIEKVRKRVPLLKKIKKIIVESQYHYDQLTSLGIDEQKIKLIYPPADLKKYHYQETTGKFKVLYASCPTREEDFEKRGIFLLLEYAKENPEIIFNLAWRKGAYKEICELLDKHKMENIIVKDEIIKDINVTYGDNHCTIIPYTKFDDFLKLVPNSAIESLAAGKPLLVSNKTELAKMINEHKCGLSFEPTKEGLQKSIEELQKNYYFYQQNCRGTAEKLFSKKSFISSYNDIYKKL